jgi:hypothetical protein
MHSFDLDFPPPTFPPQALSDVPYANFVPELLKIAPSLRVAHTLREPYLWTERRVRQHGGDDTLCLPPYAGPNATGAFFLAECLEGLGGIGARFKSALDVMAGLYGEIRIEPRIRDKFTRPLDAALSRAFTVQHDFAYGAFHAHNQRVAAYVPPARYWQFCFWDGENASNVFAPLLEGLEGAARAPE